MTVQPASASIETTFSRLTTIPVRTEDGTVLGRIIDARLDALSAAPSVDLVIVGSRRVPRFAIPWEAVDLIQTLDGEITISLTASDASRYRIRAGASDDEAAKLFLRRDVIDSQVVDLSGSRLSRVSEVLLVGGQDGGLTAIAVDLGLGALLVRMGFGPIGRRMKGVIVAWEDLYLASAGGHRVELSASSERLRRLEPGTVAEVLARLHTERAAQILQTVAPVDAASALATSHELLRRNLLRSMPPDVAAAVAEVGPPVLERDLAAPAGSAPHPGRRFLRTAGWRVRRPTIVKR